MNSDRSRTATGGASRFRAAGLVLLALLSGLLFFRSLGSLWPLAPIDLVASESLLIDDARVFLENLDFDLDGFEAAEWFRLDSASLDYVERVFGNEQAGDWIEAGLPIFEYRVAFKRAGNPTVFRVSLHPYLGVTGWTTQLARDAESESFSLDQARRFAHDTLRRAAGIDLSSWIETSSGSERLPGRIDHRFEFERELSASPELRERMLVVVAGDRLATATRDLIVPAAAEREARRRQSTVVALETVGFALLGVAATAAFVVFLRRMNAGGVRLGRAAALPVAVFVCFTCASALDSFRLFLAWDPMWPRVVANFRELFLDSANQIWVLLILLAVVAAGDALDRDAGAGRGDSLWALARGRLLDRSVALASARGFLIGLVCGGVMAALVLLFGVVADGRTSIQPRGFFFYPLNSDLPAVTTLLFFFGVSLAEELGYRFFGGTWLLGMTRSRIVAILVPALVYGLTHTGLDFLPPAEPFWARPVVLTAVGCVWGWAFLRFDALTVVLSHFTADLFIFNWPRLASGQTEAVVSSVATFAVPLLPALLWPLFARRAQRAGSP